jgi:cAMP-dependent protein kinase regulator
VDILSTIDHYELSQVSDALAIKKYKAGDVIINQGDQGDVFYILEEGVAFASRVFNEKGNYRLIYVK